MTRTAVELTLEQKAVKFEQQRLKQAQHCKNWVAKNKEKQRKISADYYARNKVEYNKKCVIYNRKRREAKKAENADPPPES
jgi:hypothetical protein